MVTERTLLERLVLIGLAGALGAVCRYSIQVSVNHLVGSPTVAGTFLVNISGAFLLGLLFSLSEHGVLANGHWRPMLAAGFLGAYTTFSTLMLDSTVYAEDGQFGVALLNLGGSVFLGLAAAYLGLALGRALS